MLINGTNHLLIIHNNSYAIIADTGKENDPLRFLIMFVRYHKNSNKFIAEPSLKEYKYRQSAIRYAEKHLN